MTRESFTPYDDSEDVCDRTAAVLRVYPGELDPDEVTARLQVEPTRIARQGRVVVRSNGFLFVEPLNAWWLSSEEKVASKDLRRHLDWLLGRLEGRGEALRGLRGEGVTAYLFIPWWVSAGGWPGPVLWPVHLKGLAELAVECEFSFADYSDE